MGTLLVKSLYFLRWYFDPSLTYKDIMSSSKEKLKEPGKSWARIANEEDICERDPNGLFVICGIYGEVKMRRQFDSGC